MPPIDATPDDLAQELSLLSPTQLQDIVPVRDPHHLLEWLSWSNNVAFKLRLLETVAPRILHGALVQKGPLQLEQWLSWSSDSHICKFKLLKTADPDMLCRVLRLIDADSQAEYLCNMEDRQRLFVVLRLTEHERALALQRLDSWQERKIPNYHEGLIDSLVMTSDRLPPSYPTDMESCISCGKGYEVWASVLCADCCVHSLCETCAEPDGCCTQCDA